MENRVRKQVFHVEVPIPENMILIDKEEYLGLLNQNEQGKWWSIDDVMQLLGIGRTKLINDILLNPRFKGDIDIEQNVDGFVVYPKSKGAPYKFLASKARVYFEANFASILLQQ